MTWCIFNAAGWRWGQERFATESDARQSIKEFFTNVRNVRLERFYVLEYAEDQEPTRIPQMIDLDASR